VDAPKGGRRLSEEIMLNPTSLERDDSSRRNHRALKEKVTKVVQIVRARGVKAMRPARIPGKGLHFSATIMGRNKEFGSLAILLKTSPSREATVDGVMRMPACATLFEF
jgi:hypothetical protein